MNWGRMTPAIQANLTAGWGRRPKVSYSGKPKAVLKLRVCPEETGRLLMVSTDQGTSGDRGTGIRCEWVRVVAGRAGR